ncbi:unnamed protein product [Owenia fusiformis]|uniref:Uncharacterized protein n=1 Tax=Owenia fusiformis TaxID=6347 RepID=A0A8J1T7B8_OWEFU|nr:unnamed protein product [Owenia fusiformis]
MDYLALNNGAKMPQLGLGTWKSAKGAVTEAVKTAIDIGYRNIDCAFAYGNEDEVGEALKAKLDDGTVKREDLFVGTKLWNVFHRKDLVMPILKKQLESLRLDYVDLYLIHWPMAYIEERESFPKDENGKFIYSDVHFLETWKAMEECVDSGLCRAIGLSNFNHNQIQDVYDNARIKPANLQIEVHPYLSQERMLAFCRERNITVTAYSPLGSGDRPWVKAEDPNLFEDAQLKDISAKYGKSVAQVILKWNIQRGVGVIPKSVTPSRIKENLEVFDFKISDADMATISSFNKDFRGCLIDWVKDHPLWPFKNCDF